MLNREQTIIILNRLTANDSTTVVNVLIDFLNSEGNQDVAAAFITAFNTTSLKATTLLDSSLVSQAQNRNFSAHTHHTRS